MIINKTNITTQSVSTQSLLEEEIFKSYVFLNLGKTVFLLFFDEIDSICLGGRTHIDSGINVTSDSEVPFDNDGQFSNRILQIAFVGDAFLERAAISEDDCGVLMRLDGNISRVLRPSVDDTGLLVALPPYSLLVLVNVLSLSLLYLVSPFHNVALMTCLTSMAVFSLLTSVIAIIVGVRLDYLLYSIPVLAVAVLSLIVPTAWRQMHGTTLTLGAALDAFSFVLGELSSVEDVSVLGIAARLVEIKEKLCSKSLVSIDTSKSGFSICIGRLRRCLVLVVLVTAFIGFTALVLDYTVLTLLAVVAVAALDALLTMMDKHKSSLTEVEEISTSESLLTNTCPVESPQLLAATAMRDVDVYRVVPFVDVTESRSQSSCLTDSGVEVSDTRISSCINLRFYKDTAQDNYSWYNLLEKDYLIDPVPTWAAPKLLYQSLYSPQLMIQRGLSTGVTGAEGRFSLFLRNYTVPKTTKGKTPCSKTSREYLESTFSTELTSRATHHFWPLFVQWSSKTCAVLCATEDRLLAPSPRHERQREDYSMSTVITRGLSVTKEEPESLCSLLSVFEWSLRAVVRDRSAPDTEDRLYQECLEQCRDVILVHDIINRFENLWQCDEESSMDALCSELLGVPGVRAGLKEVSGHLGAHDLAGTHSGTGGECAVCQTMVELPRLLWYCKDTRCIEESLARIRSVCRPLLDIQDPAYRVLHRVVLSTGLHRARTRCLQLE